MKDYEEMVDNCNVLELRDALSSDRNATLFDCRSLDEYNQEHIQDAVLMTIGFVALEINNHKIDFNQEVYVICRSGRRSVDATLVLKQLGYTNVKNVSGGMVAWNSFKLLKESA